MWMRCRVSYAVEFACDSGLAAVACNLSNLISFAILLAVANLGVYAPHTMVPTMLGTSAALLVGTLSTPNPKNSKT